MDDRCCMLDVVLNPGRDKSLRRRHPWVLSGAIREVRGAEQAAGAWARVISAEGETLGWGHFSPASGIRVRILSFGKDEVGDDFVGERVVQAVARRAASPMLGETDAVRLVNAEGDGLPGLVVDRYADVLVVSISSAGMELRREVVARALREATGASCGFERSDPRSARREGFGARQGALWGEPPSAPVAIRERARHFRVDLVNGQKTGFYLDQRDARDLVARIATGRRVLDVFSYTGGFAVSAARAQAASVTLVESSAAALELARAHLVLNDASCETRFEQADAFRFLRVDAGEYDLIILDPPPFARHRSAVSRATRAYKDLLLHGIRRAAPGGYVLAFACSHHVGPELFRKVAFGAALDAGRPTRVLCRLSAPADHPVSIDHPEGEYLTGLLLQIE